jgi:hypothetical protein
MKRAGELLSAFLDEKMLNKARGYSKLFLFWTQITQKYQIAAAADHTRILDIDHGILIVEADHPGWIQILQTKEHRLLSDLQRQFPELEIAGLSFRLSKGPIQAALAVEEPKETAAEDTAEAETSAAESPYNNPYDNIKDEDFKNTLKSLEKSILQNSGARKKRHN